MFSCRCSHTVILLDHLAKIGSYLLASFYSFHAQVYFCLIIAPQSSVASSSSPAPRSHVDLDITATLQNSPASHRIRRFHDFSLCRFAACRNVVTHLFHSLSLIAPCPIQLTKMPLCADPACRSASGLRQERSWGPTAMHPVPKRSL